MAGPQLPGIAFPWDIAGTPPKFSEDKWGLYNTNEDFSQSQDLAAKNPDKLQELQRLFLEEAEKYKRPAARRQAGRAFCADNCGQAFTDVGRTSVTLYPGMTATLENATLDIKNRSHTITAEIEIPQETAQGVIVAQGGRFAGWSLYVKDGKLKYCYNWLNRERYTLESKKHFGRKATSNSTSTMMAAVSVRAAPDNFCPTAKRSPKAESTTLYRLSSQGMKPRTSARTSARQ